MAYAKPADLDEFIAQMGKSDVRIKTQLAEDLVAYLGDQDNTLMCMDLGLLIDALVPWLTGSHFKVSICRGRRHHNQCRGDRKAHDDKIMNIDGMSPRTNGSMCFDKKKLLRNLESNEKYHNISLMSWVGSSFCAEENDDNSFRFNSWYSTIFFLFL